MKITTTIILTICLVIIALLWSVSSKGQTKKEEPKDTYNKDEAEKFVKQLAELVVNRQQKVDIL